MIDLYYPVKLFPILLIVIWLLALPMQLHAQVAPGDSSIKKNVTDSQQTVLRPYSQLRTIDIRASTPQVKKELDRLIYDVQSDPDHRSQSVLDILAKVPLITVDGENNIKLKGQGNFKVFINGKPSAITASNPKEALRAMSAVNIASIEVITTPPAKYDGEGFTGIINIVTVKQRNDGYNASVGVGFNKVSGVGQNYTLQAKKGKWGISSTGYLYEDLKRTNATSLYQQSTTAVLRQEGTTAYHSIFGGASLEASYEIDSLQLLTSAVSVYKSRDYYLTSQYTSTSGTSYQYTNNHHLYDNSLDISVGYDKAARRNSKEIFSLGYRFHHSPQQLANSVFYEQVTGESLTDFGQQNNNHLDEHTLQADYVLPLSSIQIESGIKGIWRDGNSKYLLDEHTAGPPGFLYKQQVYSLYHSYQLNTPVLAVKAGARLEYTAMDVWYGTGKSIVATYYNLIPVLSLQHDFPNSSLSFGFTRRSERPGIEQLNPFIDKRNPNQFNTGNPALRPVMQNSAELSFLAGKKVSYHLIGSFLFANNTIEKLTNFTDSNAITTYKNIGSNRDLHLNAGFSYPLSAQLKIIMNADAGYAWLKGSDGENSYRNSGFIVSGFLNLQYKIADSWRLTTTLYAITPSVSLQGKTNGNLVHTIRVNKELFKKKATVTFSVSNPYSKYRYIRTTQTGGAFDQLSVQQLNYRNYGVSFTYTFGKLSQAIRKNQQLIRNDDVKTASKKSN